MAVADHNVTRRLWLGAAEAVPAAPPQDLAAWTIAFAAFGHAEAELNAFCAACRQAGLRYGIPEMQAILDEEFGCRLALLHEALKRLLLTPARDADALTLKFALSVEHDIFSLDGAEACLAAIRQDALRLCQA